MKRYLALDGLFEGARNFAGAISTAYIVSKGLPLAVVAELKLVQAAFIFVGEYPAGIFADMFGRRLSLAISLALGALTFWLYATGSSILVFAIAEACLGLMLCFWSGAFEAYSISGANLESDSYKMNRFFHLNSSVNGASLLAAGFLGGLMGSLDLRLPYFASAILLLGLMLALLIFYPKDQIHKSAEPHGEGQMMKIKSGFRATIANGPLMKIAAAFVVLQFLCQPMIYYWQAYFLEAFPDKIKTPQLGSIFVAFQISLIVSGVAFAKLSKRDLFRSSASVYVLMVGFLACLAIMPFSSSALAAVAWFCLAEAHFAVLVSALKARIGGIAEASQVASVFSLVNFMSTIGSMASLGIISLSLKFISVANLFKVSMSAGIIFVFFLWAASSVGVLRVSRHDSV